MRCRVWQSRYVVPAREKRFGMLPHGRSGLSVSSFTSLFFHKDHLAVKSPATTPISSSGKLCLAAPGTSPNGQDYHCRFRVETPAPSNTNARSYIRKDSCHSLGENYLPHKTTASVKRKVFPFCLEYFAVTSNQQIGTSPASGNQCFKQIPASSSQYIEAKAASGNHCLETTIGGKKVGELTLCFRGFLWSQLEDPG